jgi:hypothetical protein
MNSGPGSSLGVTYGLETIFAINGTRDSSLTSFGYAAAGRRNAQIIQQATATKIGQYFDHLCRESCETTANTQSQASMVTQQLV